MNREEAISLMNELLQKCPKLDNIFMCLAPPNPSAPMQQGYQVHLNIKMDQEVENCVTEITEERSLLVNEEKTKAIVIIYRKH